MVQDLAEGQGALRTFGWIDSMSITQVVQAFDVWPNGSFPYGWDIPAAVTSLLVCTDSIHLAPGLSEGRIVSTGPIGLVTRELVRSGVLSRPRLSESARELALRQTKQDVSRDSGRFRSQYHRLLKQDSAGVRGWMAWSIRSAWVEHAQNSGSLLDAEFVPQLALILDLAEKEVLDLLELTSSLHVVRDFVKRQPDTDAFNMAYNCFLLAALVRGRYHDYLARQTGQQVWHHPFRQELLPNTNMQPLVYGETTVESYLTNIVLHSALSQRKLESRLARWADNVGRIRAARRPGIQEISLPPTQDPDLARKEAVRAAQVVGIDVHPSWFEEVVNGGIAALGVATGFLLDPYSSIPIGLGTYAVSRRIDVGEQLGRRVYGRQGRISRLAKSPPGRISRTKTESAVTP